MKRIRDCSAVARIGAISVISLLVAGCGGGGEGEAGEADATAIDAAAGGAAPDAARGDAGGGGEAQPKPSADNTGPRIDIERTLSPDDALEELRETGYLSGVLITGHLRLGGSDGCGWVIEDSVVHAGLYGIQTYVSLDDFDCPSGDRPVFEHVEIVGQGARDDADGTTSALFYGSDAILRHVNGYGGADALKTIHRVEVFASYFHDLHHPEGAHADAVQIRSGSDSLFHWNYFDARVGYGTNVGDNGSGGLQTGSLNGSIEAVEFRDNWWNGGHYTIRMGDEENIDYLFRDNKHGRDFTYGPVNGCTDCPYSGGGVRYDDSNVWEDTGEPVR